MTAGPNRCWHVHAACIAFVCTLPLTFCLALMADEREPLTSLLLMHGGRGAACAVGGEQPVAQRRSPVRAPLRRSTSASRRSSPSPQRRRSTSGGSPCLRSPLARGSLLEALFAHASSPDARAVAGFTLVLRVLGAPGKPLHLPFAALHLAADTPLPYAARIALPAPVMLPPQGTSPRALCPLCARASSRGPGLLYLTIVNPSTTPVRLLTAHFNLQSQPEGTRTLVRWRWTSAAGRTRFALQLHVCRLPRTGPRALRARRMVSGHVRLCFPSCADAEELVECVDAPLSYFPLLGVDGAVSPSLVAHLPAEALLAPSPLRLGDPADSARVPDMALCE